MEIFSTYGKIKMIDMPVERMHPHLSKGYAYTEFENPDEAEKVLKHMDGGQIDGQEITATAVLAPWPRPPPRRFSPPRRMPPPPPTWRRSPPRMRRRSRSPRRRSPVRRRSRSPGRHRHRSRSSSNSSLQDRDPPRQAWTPFTSIQSLTVMTIPNQGRLGPTRREPTVVPPAPTILLPGPFWLDKSKSGPKPDSEGGGPVKRHPIPKYFVPTKRNQALFESPKQRDHTAGQ
ncbi:hypothetical protein P7K49_010803 [Saguinus oedipus]|uniref:RNA-binding protein with serine-rich domain 1 n=1 Tax=Saguinus oedipus TaxID=9490 RepID=A0ABQ9VP76_SAGOE|nr:hypothetical protein P7K49_010803 [Saguinus oedipus]